MSPPARRSNPGPSAAAGNREAVIAAARHLLDDVGADVPMSRIAAEAGVGQAVLYRVFPDRATAIWEVFRDDLDVLEQLAVDVDLPRLLGHVTRSAARSTGFMQLAAGNLGDLRLRELCDRFEVALATCLGRTPPPRRPARPLGVTDLALAVQMVSGVLVTTAASDRLSVAQRAWDLLGVVVDLGEEGR